MTARKTRKNKYWGYHLIVDASDCIPEAIRSSKTIKEFTKELVDKIDMVAYGAPKLSLIHI